METTVSFTVNGRDRTVTTDGRRMLLDVLREELNLTGTKYGCGRAECGACSVLIDGERVRWRPAIDVNRIAFGLMLLSALALLVWRSVEKARQTSRPRE